MAKKPATKAKPATKVKPETKAQKAQRKPVESGGTKADIFKALSNMKSEVCSSELSSVDRNKNQHRTKKTSSRERLVPDSFGPPEADIIFNTKTLEKKDLKKSPPAPLARRKQYIYLSKCIP